jgi:hypothetical protein
MLANVAGAIAILKNASTLARTPGDLLNFTLKMRDENVTAGSFSPEETAGIRRFVALLEKTEGMSMVGVSNAIGTMASLFYPTENMRFTDQLGYYRQREWRIVSGTRLGLQDMTLPTIPEQQEQLLQIDAEFFKRPIELPDGTSTVSQRAHFMPAVAGKHVLTQARRVVAPDGCEEAAIQLLGGLGFRIAVVGASKLAN